MNNIIKIIRFLTQKILRYLLFNYPARILFSFKTDVRVIAFLFLLIQGHVMRGVDCRELIIY